MFFAQAVTQEQCGPKEQRESLARVYLFALTHALLNNSKCFVPGGRQAEATRPSRHWVQGWPVGPHGWDPFQDYLL